MVVSFTTRATSTSFPANQRQALQPLFDTDFKPDFTYVSFGAGVQSTALLVMSNLALRGCPRADVAIFADTQCEPRWVYDHISFMEQWSAIPIIRVTLGNLGRTFRAWLAGKRRHAASIPVWTVGANGRGAPLRRSCTRDYKIVPIERKVRELLGYQRGQRIKAHVACLIGLSAEELTRVRTSRVRWSTNLYPLIEARMRREDCAALLRDHRLPVPRRSACVFCPFHSDEYWRELREHPGEWKRAVKFDRAIRDMGAVGVRSSVYLHRSCQPLEVIDFSNVEPRQPDGFQNECLGHCGN
jgi:hypothetical protein